MFRRTKVNAGVLAALGAMSVGSALAQTQQTQTLEKVEVTGSRIKRIDAEGANPVQVIGRQEIERSGAATLNDVLQQITGNGAGIDDRITNGFAPGGGGLNLRNLGFNSTLVLVNGRRVATYPFAQQVGTAQGFNDTQNIPISAVERVEILKDGASAIYGADAVAGVVNIILRSDYTGLEIGANLGRSSKGDGTTRGANLTFGKGSLTNDGFNFLVGANFSKRDEIKSRSRSFAGTEDLRSAGGTDRRSGYGYPGTIVDEVTGDTYYDAGGTCGPTTQRGGSSIRGGLCRYDRAQLGSLLPASEKTGVYTKLSLSVTPDITAFGEVLFTRNKFKSTGWPAGTTDDVGIGSYIIPGGTPGNPFPNDADAYYRFADVGNRGDDGKTDTTHMVLGLKGATAGWDWEAGANLNKIKVSNLAKNNALTSRVMCLTNPAAAASYAAGGDPLGLGTLDSIFAANPAYATYFKNELAKCGAAFAQYGYYNYQNPSANTAGVADYLRHDATREGRSTLNGVDFKASRELAQIGGGALALAVGGEYRKEKVSDIPDLELQTGDTLSISAAQAFGDRKVGAAYVELVAPFTQTFEADFAVRHDKYSGNGKFAATSPKIGLRYQPVKEFLVRGTYSKAFRAPSLFETSPAQQTSFAFGIQDPVNCPVFDGANPDCVLDVRRVQQGNPNLQAEKSTAVTAGVVFEPTRNVTLSFDAWRINRKNEIGSFDDQVLTNVYANDPNIVVRNASGRVVQINQVPVQLNKTTTWGVDVEAGTQNDLGEWGRLSTKVGFSYVGSYKFTTLDDTGAVVPTQFNGTYNQPRWRTSWDMALNQGNWEYGVSGYGIGGYEGLGTTAHVRAQDIWNVSLAYTGVKNLRLRFGINNILNQRPPFDDETSGSNAGYNPQLADPVGRFYNVSLSYKFF